MYIDFAKLASLSFNGQHGMRIFFSAEDWYQINPLSDGMIENE